MTLDPLMWAIVAALTFGAGDFAGGRSAHRIGAPLTVVIVQLLAAGLVGAWVLWRGLSITDPQALRLGLAAGLADGFALMLLYHGLAVGRIAIVAPLSSVISVVLPSLFEGLFVREIGLLAALGIGLALVAVVLLGRAPHDDGSRGSVGQSIVLGVAGGVMFGITNLSLGLVQPEHGMTGLLMMRVTAAAVALVLLAVLTSHRPKRMPTASDLGLASFAGVLDAAGLGSYVVAATQGLIGVASAVLSLYAGITVLLGLVLLKERISRSQVAGLAVSAASVVLLAAALH